MTKFSTLIAALALIAATTGTSLANYYPGDAYNLPPPSLTDILNYNPIDSLQTPVDGPYMEQAPDYPVDPGCGMTECAPEFIEAPEPVDPPEIVFD